MKERDKNATQNADEAVAYIQNTRMETLDTEQSKTLEMLRKCAMESKINNLEAEALYRIINRLMVENLKFAKVWKFDLAPEEYKALSTSGGDEDYLVFIPEALTGLIGNVDDIAWWQIGLGWMDHSGFDWQTHIVPGGLVRISDH